MAKAKKTRKPKKAAKKATKKRAKKAPKKLVKKTSKKRKPNAAFMKPLLPSEDLSVIVGAKALPRTKVVSLLWAYIKEHGLQDKTKRTMINADAALSKVFGGKKRVTMFEMTKLVSKHLQG